ncbi:maltose acetyltransferase domain-containing protein [Ferrimonas balearica]|uniref:maltose acetyltransferase domain-containing protein n=1 Tax=Ferrimonas balearica TaxID=44012 RepID=UPI0002DC3D66|nr:maltose acetyltransferase domain-containing protein [Ferrimonas balearica]
MPEALGLMRAGEPYQGMDPTLVALRMAAWQRCRQLNEHDMADQAGRQQLAEQLFESCGDNLWLEAPFQCDYGIQIRLGDNVFINMDCVILDCAPVTIAITCCWGPRCRSTPPVTPLRRHPGGMG